MTAAASDLMVTDELRAWLGRSTPLVPLVLITESDVRRYVDATGDDNPLWLDDDFARRHGYRGRLLPPTLVGWVPFSIKEREGPEQDLRRQLPLPGFTNVRNAGSQTHWLRPVHLGEQLYRRDTLVDITIHRGRAGEGFRVSQDEQVLTVDEEVVLRRHHTMVLLREPAAAPAQGG